MPERLPLTKRVIISFSIATGLALAGCDVAESVKPTPESDKPVARQGYPGFDECPAPTGRCQGATQYGDTAEKLAERYGISLLNAGQALRGLTKDKERKIEAGQQISFVCPRVEQP